jgi:hypothetical protein
MKTLTIVIAGLAFACVALAEQPREGRFVFNADLPKNAVEVASDFVPTADDFWQEPPAQRPEGLPATCVLVEVYQRQRQYEATSIFDAECVMSGLVRIGWTYMQAEDVNWLHSSKNSSL